MDVYRIAHAGLVVEGGGARCLMDPVFVDPFECKTNTFEPPVAIDGPALARTCDLVVLSHEHNDHFCVESLAAVPRDRPVVYPAGCGLIEHALAVLGFADTYAVSPGEERHFRGLRLRFTPSNVVFPEMGVVFSADSRTVWNLVDTEIDDASIAAVLDHLGPVDVLLAPYQVLVEEELGCDGLGSGFPFERYADRVRQVVSVAPRCVVPSSCGYRYHGPAWLNRRGFPVTEHELLADVRAIAPAILGRTLAPGDRLEVAGLGVHPAALPHVIPGPATPSAPAWRPDLGVPRLDDDDPHRVGVEGLARATRALLDDELLAELDAPRLAAWRARMATMAVLWQLDVVYPGATVETRWLDLADGRLRWSSAPTRPPKIITSICASTLAGLRDGAVTPYRALFTRRVVTKLYAVVDGTIERAGKLADEPIAQALFPGANRRHVDWLLARVAGHTAG